MREGKLMILTGEIEAGKTTLCTQVADLAQEQGVDLAGVISPPVFSDMEKVAIDVIDLRTGEQRRLAERTGGENRGPRTRRWQFYPEIVRWGNQVLRSAVPCQLLIVDELGPLELERGEGWTDALEVLDRGEYQQALVVIRAHLVETATSRWPGCEIFHFSSRMRGRDTAREVFSRLKLVP